MKGRSPGTGKNRVPDLKFSDGNFAASQGASMGKLPGEVNSTIILRPRRGNHRDADITKPVSPDQWAGDEFRPAGRLC